MVQEFCGVLSLDVNFSQSCHITDADRGACHFNFTIHTVAPPFFAGARKPLCAHPITRLDKCGAIGLCPAVAWGQAIGSKILAPRTTRKRSDGNGCVRGAKDGSACFGNGFARTFGQYRKTRNIGGFSLICCHSKRGIPLQMFNRTESFLIGKLDILDRHIILKIDPSALFAFFNVPKGDP